MMTSNDWVTPAPDTASQGQAGCDLSHHLAAGSPTCYNRTRGAPDGQRNHGYIHEFLVSSPGPCLNINNKEHLSRHGAFHYKEKTVVRPSYLYNGNPYTGSHKYSWQLHCNSSNPIVRNAWPGYCESMGRLCSTSAQVINP